MTAGPKTMRFATALRTALARQLSRDERVVLLGEDICDPFGGAFNITKGLSTRFPGRVLNTPMSEAALAGLAAGMALRGLRPVLEIMFGDFLTLCADQIVNHGAKFRWMYNDRVRVPYVIRTPMGGRRGYGPTHSQTLEQMFCGIPGLKVVAPSHWHAPDELLARAIADEDPVLFIENKSLYGLEVRDPGAAWVDDFACRRYGGNYPTVVAATAEEGAADVTVAAYGGMVPHALEAARTLVLEHEVACEVVMPSSLFPLDLAPLVASVERTRRLVVVQEAPPGGGFGAAVAAALAQRALLLRLKAPLAQVTALDLPVGSARVLEDQILPGTAQIAAAVRKVMAFP